MVALLLLIALFGEKEGDRLWVSLQANDRNADMWLTYLCSEQKIYSGYK
jgi:hypothetical protein